MRHGLAVKLAILLAGIGILASGLTGIFAYSANRTMLVDAAQHNLLTSTQLLNRRFTSALQDIADDVRVLSLLPLSPRIAAARDEARVRRQQDQLARIFAAMVKVHPEYLQIRLISAARHGLERVRVDRDRQRPVRVEDLLLQEKGHFPYVFETLRLAPGQVYQSPLSINREYGTHAADGRPVLRIAAPVYSAQTVVGVLVVTVDLAHVLTTLQANLPRHFQLYLANKAGDFLIHPQPAFTFGFDKGRRFFMQDSFEATRPLFEGGARSTTLNGLDTPGQAKGRVLAFERERFNTTDPDQFVVLGLSQPLAEVLEGADSLGASIVHMVLAFSLLAIVLAALFARALTKPLNMLTHAATRFSSERTIEALPVERKDEIGVLACCFDRMRKQIVSQMNTLFEHQQEMAYLAHHDPLSGLPNRMLFFQHLDHLLNDARQQSQSLAVLFVDLDRFKDVNDQLGHAIGDQVLHTAARRLQHAVRKQDMVARLGGDEFIVLLAGIDDDETLATIARKILSSLNEPMTIAGHSVQIGASTGISLYPCDGSTAEELVQRADEAMYVAKAQGRNTFRRYRAPDIV